MTAWQVEASLEGDRFALGEPVILTLDATYLGPGAVPAPDLVGARPRSPILELRRDGEPPIVVTTDAYDVSLRQPPERKAARGVRLFGSLDLREWLEPLAAGRYEVVARLAVPRDDARSNPVPFVVEELRPTDWVLEPEESTREGERSLLRIDPRPGDARLILATPEGETAELVARDLGGVAPDARVALSVAAPDVHDRRRWAFALASGHVTAVWAGETAVTVPALDAALEKPSLLGAAAGVPVASPSREAEPVSLMAEAPPVLGHAALAGQRDGRPWVRGLTVDPAGAPARWDELPVRFPVTAGVVVALTPERRRLFLALAREGMGSIVWADWSAAGFGPVATAFEIPGEVLSLDAAATGPVSARVAALVGKGPGDATLELAIATTGESPVAPIERRTVLEAGTLPEGLVEPRVRLDSGHTVLVAEQEPGRVPILFEPGTPATVSIDAEGVPWAVELAAGETSAIVLHPTAGAVRRTFPRTPRPDGALA